MAITKQKEPVLVQAYDRSEVREYIKKYAYMFWSTDEVVHRETIKDELVLAICCPRMPDKIIFNGMEVKLITK